MRIKLFLPLLFLCLLSACNWPGPGLVTSVKLEEYGLYQEEIGKTTPAPGTAAGFFGEVVSEKLLKETDQVPAKLHSTFGITYSVNGFPKDKEIELTVKLLHPGIKNPEAAEVSKIDVTESTSSIGSSMYQSYTFDNEWEIAPGDWTYQIFYGNRMLLEKTFTVVPEKEPGTPVSPSR